MSKRILALAVRSEQDVVSARRNARQVAATLGFDAQDQVRIATAVSEIARNAQRYAGGGSIEFMLEGKTAPQVLLVTVSDNGPGIPDLQNVLTRETSSTAVSGIIGAQRLMDRCEIRSTAAGTHVLLNKTLPARAPLFTGANMEQLAKSITSRAPATPFEEIRQQNRELFQALAELRERQEELKRLNRELEDTNRGVVVLYAELDEKADHLRRANEMKSRFLSNMSHEFRTPLNSIRALTGLLAAHTDGALTSEQEKQVGYIRKSAADLTTLVDDLLDIAKIEAGKIDVRPVEFSVESLFSALRGMLRPLLLTERVNLRFEDPVGVPPLYADEAKVSQILRNFISNALKFTDRGEVRVQAQFDAAAGTVSFKVEDTGIGIAAEDQERIFDEFFQVRGPLQARVKGTGLGLPLCRKLAALMGGVVLLSSEPEVGSTFSVTIPLRSDLLPQTELDDKARLEVSGRLTRPNILLIDDDPATRHTMTKLLDNGQYCVFEAVAGGDGLRVAESMHPELIVLDLGLPDMTGERVLDELSNNPATREIPVIIATARDLSDDERHELQRKARLVLSKSNLNADLRPAVDGVFKSSRMATLRLS